MRPTIASWPPTRRERLLAGSARAASYPDDRLGTAAGSRFTVLHPSLERRFTGDRRTHDVRDLPGAAPVRTAPGIAVITLFAVVWAATWTAHPVVRYGLRVAVLVLAPLAYAVTPAMCGARAASAGPRP
ncbi:hypothetical protein [Nonomuraea dietziae]|uniref:hypothetical protein n=1 Tax=Nonomuraea dietziae TaxID=65515 RepID=UPI0034446257